MDILVEKEKLIQELKNNVNISAEQINAIRALLHPNKKHLLGIIKLYTII